MSAVDQNTSNPSDISLDITIQDDQKATLNEKKANEPDIAPDKSAPTDARRVRLRYKPRSKMEKMKEFSYVQYAKVRFLAVPMGLASLAVVWKLAETSLDAPSGISTALAYITAIHLFVFVALFLFKCATRGWHKVWKAWQHPVESHFYSGFPISLFVLSYLAFDAGRGLSETLFWIGATLQLPLSLFQLRRFFTRHQTPDLFSPLYMIAPLANMVAAFPLLKFMSTTNVFYEDFAWFCVSFATLIWLAFLTISLSKHMFLAPEDTLMVASFFVHAAPPAVLYLVLRGLVVPFGFIHKFFLFTALFALLVCSLVIVEKRFWSLGFSVSWWAIPFPLCLVTAAMLDYHSIIDGAGSEVLASVLLVLATGATLGLYLFTIYQVFVNKQMFKSDDKWGPVSFMILMHKALKPGFKKSVMMATKLSEKPNNAELRMKLVKHFAKLVDLLHEHTRHEDDFFFPFLNFHQPHHTDHATDDHHAHPEKLENLASAIAELADGQGVLAKVTALLPALKGFTKELMEHLAWEEMHVSPCNRKYNNFEMMKWSLQQIFTITPMDKWRTLLPFMLTMQPKPLPRRRTLQCLRYAFPERMQLFGIWIYEGVSPELWDELTKEVPEIIPRGVRGWHRYW